MKTKTWIFFVVLLGLFPITGRAQFTYSINGGRGNFSVTITGYTGSGGNVTIPSSIKVNLLAYAVTAIGFGAFAYNTNITSITIPDSVTDIGDDAFEYSAMTNANLGNGVTSIGYDAFTLSGLTSVTIPASVTNINRETFMLCSYLTSVTIGSGVTSIGDDAFEYCIALTNITFLGNPPTLGSAVFGVGGTLLDPALDPATVYYYLGATGWGSTYGNLPTEELFTSGNFEFAVTNGALMLIGYTGPGGAVTIPSSFTIVDQSGHELLETVTAIGALALNGNTAITGVTIPGGVTSIGALAFGSCSSLTSITLPVNVRSLDAGAFSNCTELASISLGSVKSLGINAFEGCTHLSKIVIPNSVTNVDVGAFSNCYGLTNVVIGNEVINLGSYAFYNCSGLTSVTIPASVTSIGSYAFAFGYVLKSLYFLGDPPALASNAFYTLSSNATVYYYYGTSGWGLTYGGLPAIELAWTPQIAGLISVPTNFGFTIIGTNGMPVVIEASTNLMNWQPIWTNTLSGASTTFTDPQWKNYPTRFYRAR